MNNIAKVLIALAVVAAIALAAVLMNNSKGTESNKPNDSSSSSSSDSSSSSTNNSDVAIVITYDGTGFTASKTTMKAGDKVEVTNKSTVTLDFDSDPHPVHTDNTELNVGDIEPGESKTFIVDKTGTWGYHNHKNASQHGEISVE